MFGFVFVMGWNPEGGWEVDGAEVPKLKPRFVFWGGEVVVVTGEIWEAAPKSNPNPDDWGGWLGCTFVWGLGPPNPIKSKPEELLVGWGWGAGEGSKPNPSKSPPEREFWDVWTGGVLVGPDIYRPKILKGSSFWRGGWTTGAGLVSNENPPNPDSYPPVATGCFISAGLLTTLKI